MYRRQSILSNIPQAVKGLLIINIAMLVITFLLGETSSVNLKRVLGLYFFESQLFEPYQIITHMFMHGGPMHLVFNMYALWLFGQAIERVWGPKKFLIYYFVTGLGAVVLHSFVQYLEYQPLMSVMPTNEINFVLAEGPKIAARGQNWTAANMGNLNGILHFPTVGASGAVFGILLAFGMLFPNVELQLMFVPVPIKAKYFVIGYGVLELLLGINNAESDNIAHFAHLGGMLFGFIMIKMWGKGKGPNSNFYKQY